MTPQSIGIAFLIAAVTAIVAGFAFRGRRWRSDLTFACGSIVGLVFMRASKPADLWQSLRPSVALDWLPWFGLAAVAIAVGTKPLSMWRWASATVFAVAVAGRSLWQSIYMRDLTSSPIGDNAITIVCIAGWIALLLISLAPSADAPPKRFSASVIAWATAVACTAIVIAMTGSLTYAAAVGTIAIAVLATLLVTGSLPTIAGVSVIALIGLSVAFSELPPTIATLLALGIVGLVASTKTTETSSPRSQWYRWPSVALASVATTIVVAGQLKTEDQAPAGYSITPTQTQPPTQTSPSETPPQKTPPGEMPDPFGGMGLP